MQTKQIQKAIFLLRNASDLSDLSEAMKILLSNKIKCTDLFSALRYLSEGNKYKAAEFLHKQIKYTKNIIYDYEVK